MVPGTPSSRAGTSPVPSGRMAALMLGPLAGGGIRLERGGQPADEVVAGATAFIASLTWAAVARMLPWLRFHSGTGTLTPTSQSFDLLGPAERHRPRRSRSGSAPPRPAGRGAWSARPRSAPSARPDGCPARTHAGDPGRRPGWRFPGRLPPRPVADRERQRWRPAGGETRGRATAGWCPGRPGRRFSSTSSCTTSRRATTLATSSLFAVSTDFSARPMSSVRMALRRWRTSTSKKFCRTSVSTRYRSEMTPRVARSTSRRAAALDRPSLLAVDHSRCPRGPDAGRTVDVAQFVSVDIDLRVRIEPGLNRPAASGLRRPTSPGRAVGSVRGPAPSGRAGRAARPAPGLSRPRRTGPALLRPREPGEASEACRTGSGCSGVTQPASPEGGETEDDEGEPRSHVNGLLGLPRKGDGWPNRPGCSMGVGDVRPWVGTNGGQTRGAAWRCADRSGSLAIAGRARPTATRRGDLVLRPDIRA